MCKLQARMEGIFLKVIVIPNAAKTEIVEQKKDYLKIRLKAVPAKGKANEELLKFLKKKLKIKARIVKGSRNREKILEIL